MSVDSVGRQMDDVLSKACDLIITFEGFKPKPYQNPGDRPTIGYGSTFYEDYKPVTLQDSAIDWARARKILEFFVQKSIDMVNSVVDVPLTMNQQIALASFEYNTGHLKGSTLLELLNAGQVKLAANEFTRWIYAGGQISKGLILRRKKEQQIFVTPDGQ